MHLRCVARNSENKQYKSDLNTLVCSWALENALATRKVSESSAATPCWSLGNHRISVEVSGDNVRLPETLSPAAELAERVERAEIMWRATSVLFMNGGSAHLS
jgi:hypothetical protein